MTRFRFGATALLLTLASQVPVLAEDASSRANWSSLSEAVTLANIKAGAVNTRIDRAVACGQQGKVYAPGATGVTATDCLETSTVAGVSLTTFAADLTSTSLQAHNMNEKITAMNGTMASLISCGRIGLGFNGTACTGVSAPKPVCTLQSVPKKNPKCPTGYVFGGTLEGTINPGGICIRMACK